MHAQVKVVTIIVEDEIEQKLLADLGTAGMRGYTLMKVRGKGMHRLRGTEWEGENIMIETLVSKEVADSIFALLESHYFSEFSVTAYMQDAEVIRGQKYL